MGDAMDDRAAAAAWVAELGTLRGVMSARHPTEDARTISQLATGILCLSALPGDHLLVDAIGFLRDDARRRGLELPAETPEAPDRPTREELGEAVTCIRRVKTKFETWCGRDPSLDPALFENVDHAILCRAGRAGVPESFTAVPCPYCLDAVRAELR